LPAVCKKALSYLGLKYTIVCLFICTYYCGQKKWDIKFLSVLKNSMYLIQTLLSFFFYTILADSLNIYFILLFSFSKCHLLLIKVDFDWDFALNKHSLRAYLQVGLESDKGYFTLKVKTMTLMSHFFARNSTVGSTEFRAAIYMSFTKKNVV
jgi:hypothetical protein